jgi:hypothetical protein
MVIIGIRAGRAKQILPPLQGRLRVDSMGDEYQTGTGLKCINDRHAPGYNIKKKSVTGKKIAVNK